MSTLDEAIQVIRAGNREEGRRLLEEILESNENDEQVWLWLTSVVDDDEDREVCLENVLALNPDNVIAQKGLEALRTGTFNVHNIMSQVLAEQEIEPETIDPAITFRDEFFKTPAASEFEEEELVMPSTMAKTKPPKAKGRGINLRVVLLLALVLIVVVVLGGLAAANYFLGGGNEGPVNTPEQPGQVAPAGSEETVPVATETPTLEPTVTPTFTSTPDLSLPTRRPTEPPTPTSTPVVPPTPR